MSGAAGAAGATGGGAAYCTGAAYWGCGTGEAGRTAVARVLGLCVLGLRVLLVVRRSLILLRPSIRLPARHSVAHCGRGARNDSGAGHPTDQSHRK